MTNNLAIEVKDLSQSFKNKLALDGVSFAVNEGEMLALVGASGSGKSTLLRNLNGLQIADTGVINIFDTPIQRDGNQHSRIRRFRSQIGFIFQQFNLVSRLTVLDNVLLGSLARVSLTRSLFRQFSKTEKLQALAALERVGILEQAYQRASTLSGGQQQRVAIARTLMQEPKLILVD
ncbi:MAG: phosphonate ABC transporter ATP-binding protein [Xenococcus sp. (in: cyanobacteria)]